MEAAGVYRLTWAIGSQSRDAPQCSHGAKGLSLD